MSSCSSSSCCSGSETSTSPAQSPSASPCPAMTETNIETNQVKEEKLKEEEEEEENAAATATTGTGFEGPEKILEVDFFEGNGEWEHSSMRDLTREQWDSVLSLARCQILSKMSNESCDSYVLSESSLFVFEYKVFIKTCGTTTLLRCLPLLLELAENVGLKLKWLSYSRKNYIFPDDQEYPHNSFAHEIEYAKQCSGPRGNPLKGGAYVLGDLQGDHWYVYVCDYSDDCDSDERSVNIMMYGLDPVAAAQFFRQPSLTTAQDAARVTDESGIRSLCLPGTDIDDCMFEPCGYSMNGLHDETFYTIHVTPEDAFSYASFETNLELEDYTDLIDKVLRVFRPRRFVINVFADESALGRIKQCPTQIQTLKNKLYEQQHFLRETQSTTWIRDEYACRMAVYNAIET